MPRRAGTGHLKELGFEARGRHLEVVELDHHRLMHVLELLDAQLEQLLRRLEPLHRRVHRLQVLVRFGEGVLALDSLGAQFACRADVAMRGPLMARPAAIGERGCPFGSRTASGQTATGSWAARAGLVGSHQRPRTDRGVELPDLTRRLGRLTLLEADRRIHTVLLGRILFELLADHVLLHRQRLDLCGHRLSRRLLLVPLEDERVVVPVRPRRGDGHKGGGAGRYEGGTGGAGRLAAHSVISWSCRSSVTFSRCASAASCSALTASTSAR